MGPVDPHHAHRRECDHLITGSVTDHVDAATGRVKARFRVSAPVQMMMNPGWQIDIERAVWLVQP